MYCAIHNQLRNFRKLRILFSYDILASDVYSSVVTKCLTGIKICDTISSHYHVSLWGLIYYYYS